MILCVYRFVLKRSVQLNIKFLHQKYLFNMEKVYVRHIEDKLEFSFKYENADLKVNRQFNFCRQSTEPVTTFISRLVANMDKAVSKKTKRRKGQEEEKTLPGVTASVFVDGNEANGDMPCNEVFKAAKTVTMRICDKDYTVVINSPWIDLISLPKSILANFPVYPAKFDSVFTEKDLSDFTWYRLSKNPDWVEVGKGYIYTPTNEDINSHLKLSCLPRNKEQEGPVIEIASEVAVDASPGLCPFELRHNFTKERCQGKEFRVVSYNILADLYCDSDFTRTELYPYCPPYALAIDYRKQLIVKELMGYIADIICLQEVDRKVYNYDLKPILSYLGYESDFCIKGGEVAEGVACFYYKKRFKKLESHRMILSEHVNKDPLFADLWEKVSSNEKLAERFLDRTTAVQANVLESLEHNEILLVANTHLYFHPDADHIRLLQGGFAIRYLENLVSNLKLKYTNKRVSLVFCGDFNSVPECGIYKLYTMGNVPSDVEDYKSNKEEVIEDIHLQQTFQLASACGTPKYTNFTAGFADCLDYIFYEKTNLEVSQAVPLPTIEELNQNTALPSIVFPSDHISLAATLKWL